MDESTFLIDDDPRSRGLSARDGFDGVALALDAREGVGIVFGGLPLIPGPRKYLDGVKGDLEPKLSFGVRFWLRRRLKADCSDEFMRFSGERGTGAEIVSSLLSSPSMGVIGAGVSGTEDADAGPGFSFSDVSPIISVSSARLASASDFLTRASRKGLHLSFSGFIFIYTFSSHFSR
jgi:hypothetical protein